MTDFNCRIDPVKHNTRNIKNRRNGTVVIQIDNYEEKENMIKAQIEKSIIKR